jgi:hypothetical protein
MPSTKDERKSTMHEENCCMLLDTKMGSMTFKNLLKKEPKVETQMKYRTYKNTAV